MSALPLLQGEQPVVTRLAPPPAMLENPHAQAEPLNFTENSEADRDPKTGNTCDALSGAAHQHVL